MSAYLTWCDQMRQLPLTLSGDNLESANNIKVIAIPDDTSVLLKIIRPEVVYIQRIKVLGEAAYSLFDYHLNPAERVTPNVCPISGNTLWREFIQGVPGEIWRGKLYKDIENLDAADLSIVAKILGDRTAQRIALLDFIFLFQDRSARNWIIDESSNFWAIDNGMFWAYKGRYADKETVRTRKVDHLNHPMEALIPPSPGLPRLPGERAFSFQIGVFSSLYTGQIINDGLLAWLYQVNWRQYLRELNDLIGVLGYPFSMVYDWRFKMLKARAKWMLKKRRFPTMAEAFSDGWQGLVDRPERGNEEWRIEWEIES